MEQKQVLLVEDDKNIRELYGVALVNAGINILMAEDGEQGVTLALEHHPSLILMDITMPVLDGHEAVKRIRADSWGREAKIIFLTNHSEATNVAHAISQHPEDYIVKVNTPLMEIINRVRAAMY